jgi:hypothetical protein
MIRPTLAEGKGFMKRSVRPLLAAAVVLSLVTALGGVATASTSEIVGAAAPAAVDLSSRAAINGYLASRGIDPRTAVFQQGSRNYAGPACPGTGWTCTSTSRPIVQIVRTAGGLNRFVSSSTSTHGATVIQIALAAPPGGNSATCTDEVSCSITQTNTTGTNRATIRQRTFQRDMLVQVARQHADVTQVNQSGDNIADISQYVNQDSQFNDGAAVVTQDQQAFQDVSPPMPLPMEYPCMTTPGGLCQVNDTGNNSGNVDQSQSQFVHADATSVTQCQNTGNNDSVPGCAHSPAVTCPPGMVLACPNQLATGTQTSNTGTNDMDADQDINQDAHANAPTTNTQCDPVPAQGICQQQSNAEGGVEIDHTQSSPGLSTLDTDQIEHQTLKAPQGICADCQWAYGPMSKPSFQQSNPGDRTNISQFSVQGAGDNAQFFEDLIAECETSGNCHIDQEVRQNNESFSNPDHCDAMSCFEFITCFPDGGGGTFCTTVGD